MWKYNYRNQRKWGAVLSYINIFCTIGIGLVYTPVMLRLLGQSEYGLYSLIGSLVGYLSVLDMGLGNTIVRYTAQSRALGDKQQEAELNGLFLILYSIIGLICIGIGTLLYFNIDILFAERLTIQELYKAKIMMVLLIFNFAFSFPLSIFASILTAYEKFIFLRISNILRVVVNPLLVLPFLYWGYGSVMMVVVSTVLNFMCLFANAFYCLFGLGIRFSKGNFSFDFLREISIYSFFIFLNAIMDKIYWGTGQFVLGIVSGTIQVAVYAIAMQFMMMYMNLSTAISGVILPKVTMMVTKKVDPVELTNLMIKIGRIQYLIVGLIFSIFILLGQQFIYLWVGPSYDKAFPIVILLMGAMLIPLIQNVGIAILQAMNLNKYRMMTYTVCAFIALGISFPLAQYFGGIGCAVAIAFSLFISTGLLMNRYYSKVIHLDMKMFWENILSMSKGIIILLGIGFFIKVNNYFSYTWSNFILLVFLYSTLYICIMYFWCLNAYEKELLKNIISKVIMS